MEMLHSHSVPSPPRATGDTSHVVWDTAKSPAPTGLYHLRLSLLTAPHCAFSPQSQWPAHASWPRCSSAPSPAPQGPEGWLAVQPSQAQGSGPTPGPFQPVSGCGHREDQEPRRVCDHIDLFPGNSRKRLLTAFLHPSLRTVCPLHHARSSSDASTGNSLEPGFSPAWFPNHLSPL